MGIKNITAAAAVTATSKAAAAPTTERPSLAVLNQRVTAAVTAMAEAEALMEVAKAKAAAAKEEAKAIFEETGLLDLEGAEGKIQLIVAKGARRLDTKAVKALLTEDQIEDCTKVGAASTRVKFVASAAAALTEVK